MEQHEEIEMQLWEYMDGTCNAADMQRIAILIEQDSIWKQKYSELSAFHSGIANSLELEAPSMRFTQNAMDALAAAHIAPATKKYINKSLIRGIAAFFIITLTTIIGYAIATVNRGTSSTGILSKLNFSKVNFGQLFNNNTMMMIFAINIVIGLVLVDAMLRRKRVQHTLNQ